MNLLTRLRVFLHLRAQRRDWHRQVDRLARQKARRRHPTHRAPRSLP